MKISVLIPTYNSEETIQKCLQAICNQTKKPKEILICDGRSEDGTLRIARSKGAKVVGFSKNIAEARNILANAASGDLLVWIDSDVIIPPNFLEVHNLIHKKRKEVKVLSSKIKKWKAEKMKSEALPSLPSQPKVKKHSQPNITQMACSMKKEIFQEVSYDELFAKNHEDGAFTVSLARKKIKTYFSPEIIAYHIENQPLPWPRKPFSGYPLFLEKFGSWYVKYNPLHLAKFLGRSSLLYSILLSLSFTLFSSFKRLSPLFLLAFPLYYIIYSFQSGELAKPSFLIRQLLIAVEEHLLSLELLKKKVVS